MFHEGYGKGPKLKPDATSNLNDIFGVEFAKQPTPLPAARPQGAKFAVFAEEAEQPAKPVAKAPALAVNNSFLFGAPTNTSNGASTHASTEAAEEAKQGEGKKFAVFAEEAEPAAKPPAKPKGGKKFAVFAEEAEPAAKPVAKAPALAVNNSFLFGAPTN